MGLSPIAHSHTAMQDAAEVLRAHSIQPVKFALSSPAGGQDLSEALTGRTEILFATVEGLPASWCADAEGRFVLGDLRGRSAVAWTIPAGASACVAEVSYGVRIAFELGIEVLVTCAAAVALNPTWTAGDLVIVSDHINVSGRNPLVGPNVEKHGFRFPDMSYVYDADLRHAVRAAAMAAGVLPREGTLASVTRPGDITAADARSLCGLGADAMSEGIVAEAIVARHATRRVAGLAVVRNPAPDAREVDLVPIVKSLVESLSSTDA